MNDDKIIRLRLDPGRLFRWHVWLAQELRAIAGARLCIEVAASAPLPPAARALLALERALYGGMHAADAVSPDMLPPAPPCSEAALTIDITGRPRAEAGVIAPLHDGAAEEAAALAAVLAGRAPFLSILEDGRARPLGLPAMEDARVALRALDNVFARVIEGLTATARRRLEGRAPCPAPETAPDAAPGGFSAPAAARFALSSLAARAKGRIARLAGARGEKWMVGWRKVAPGESLAETLSFDEDAYAILADDGRRYYADPFVFSHEGRRVVFVEEYPYATGKGVISAFEVDEAGRAAAPRPVLEDDAHLSYPFVFASGGEIWMMPESEAAREVRLYRCLRFPDRWERAHVLLSDVAASDATLWRDGNTWWMFAAIRPPYASSWDALGLFVAERLAGPWRGHPANPVLLDAAAARPAGAMFMKNGALLRPAQDCRGGYGAGLALARVRRLDGECFLQDVVKGFRPRRKSGFHTLNAAAGLEVADFFGPPS